MALQMRRKLSRSSPKQIAHESMKTFATKHNVQTAVIGRSYTPTDMCRFCM